MARQVSQYKKNGTLERQRNGQHFVCIIYFVAFINFIVNIKINGIISRQGS